MQEIEFYCKVCKKSMKMYYTLTGDVNASVLNGVVIRCHTHKCIRAVTLKHFTEEDILKRTDANGKCFL